MTITLDIQPNLYDDFMKVINQFKGIKLKSIQRDDKKAILKKIAKASKKDPIGDGAIADGIE